VTQNGAAFRSYSYDGAGNIITDVRGSEILAYTYNNRNRLASVTRNAVAHATYQYNAFEQLVSRNTSAAGGPVGTVHYVYDLEGHLIAEADSATGASVREYIWLPSTVMYNDTPAEDMGLSAANDNVPDLPLAVVNVSATPVIYQVHSDHLSRPIRMTDGTRATVWQATWKPWGEPQSITGSQANNLRFPGQYFQLETGLAYNWHRHYDPVTGRYIQPDPLRFVDGPSVYAYAGSSPYMRTDPIGLSWQYTPFGPVWIPDGNGTPPMCMAKPVTMTVSCNVYPVQVGAVCPARVFGTGTGSDPTQAFNNAQADANKNVPRGCQKRHCHEVNPRVLPQIQ
jgi:RHS repeat-associated protein